MAKWNSADEVLNRWSQFLVGTATAALAAGFLSGVIGRARPIVLGLSMAWPSAFYAAMAWAFFLLLRSWIPPEDVPNATELAARATPFLALVTGFPAAALVCGIVGGVLGGVFGRRWSG